MPLFDPRELARRGAILRLKEIEEEAAEIRRMFPQAASPAELVKAAASNQPAKARNGRKGAKWPPAARQAARNRMKRYWATRRADEAKAEAGVAADRTGRRKTKPGKSSRGRKRARRGTAR